MQADAPIAMRERLILFSLLATTGTSIYFLLNHHPPFTPQLLPWTPLDEAMPFWLWTIWPYGLLWLGNFILPFCIRGRENFLQMGLASVMAFAILATFWALWPTTFPRPPVPLGDTINEQFYRLMVSVDTPVSCFPSGHVTLPAILLYFISRERPGRALLLWSSFAFLAISILTTKQHYWWDLVGGLLTVFCALRISQWWSDSRRSTDAKEVP